MIAYKWLTREKSEKNIKRMQKRNLTLAGISVENKI